ncbi:GGDEF domain-containing protein [Candidatus Pantoea multigeneris]|uniref:diguanylate cyclase n=1 Tax=Candidatus Pantoea multigeneris TaxID=2608357 RepID=A0ABX0RAZ8_9GAMM|nr:diguanylate cyclase [Pantoea multigeneris]NIF22530.1 GGDEF domain-containing protein [Pantoea multigeneris]
MKLLSYDELKHSKYQLSLKLFLFLNIIVALFRMFPFIGGSASGLSWPLASVALFSLLCIALCFILPKGKYCLLSPVALAIGSLWAWNINYKFQLISHYDSSFLIVSLLSIFFICAIALSDYLFAFTLATLPPAIVVLVLDQGQHIPAILLTILLPLVGFSLQHYMRRCLDRFTHRMMRQLHEEKQTFSNLSMMDPLTGLYNRRGLTNRLESILEHHMGSHYVLLLDIDHFKAYNDNYGHAMGDQALSRVSAAIRDAVRSRDVVARYGGEEFLVLITNVNATIALRMAERIRQHVLDLAIPHRFNDKVSTHVTISAGFALMEGDDFELAVASADRALYVAKNCGRNTILSAEDLPVNTHIETG